MGTTITASTARRAAITILVAAATSALGTAGASAAAVRFAAPGGTAPASSPCTEADPCSLSNAADSLAPQTALEQGDEIVVEPGTYTEATGDLGPDGSIVPRSGTTVRGVSGQARPVISASPSSIDSPFFLADRGVELRDLEIVTAGLAPALTGGDATIDGVIARASGESACQLERGVIRDSVCESSAPGRAALDVLAFSTQPESLDLTLRNDTLVASAADTPGLDVLVEGPSNVHVDGIGVLVRGGGEDIHAFAGPNVPAPGAAGTAKVSFRDSDFVDDDAEVERGGSAEVPNVGEDGNRAADPLLAADGYHELAGSPTIDAGAVDALSGNFDIDGDPRLIGAAADIGADEFKSEPPAKKEESAPPGNSGPETPPRKPGPTPPRGAKPNTLLHKKPARHTSSRRTTFTFTGTASTRKFECKLDRGKFKRCRSPLKLKALKPGAHELRVRAVGPGGVDPTPAIYRWQVY